MKKVSKQSKFKFVDLQEILCDAKTCFSAINGQLIYRDNYHLNTFGAKYVVDNFWENINN